jgi:glycosyltransferase involved in cell wall biosynthesis
VSKRIALVYDAIYPFIKGGGERRFYELGRHLVRQGYEVHLYGMKLWEGPKVITRDGLILHGISKNMPLYTASGRRSITQAIRFGLSSFKLLFANFDVIDCCGFPYFSLFPCKLAAMLKRKPLYATWHEVWGKKYWAEYLGRLGKIGFGVEYIAAKLPDCIVAASSQTATQLRVQLGASKVAVLPNGIDMKCIEKITAHHAKTNVMYAGRLVDFKNVHLIIEALALLKAEGTKLNCKVVGDGPAKKELQQLARTLGVNSQVQWLGFLEKSEDVYTHMKSADTFVLASRREGFGIVAIEANACGTPVITANFDSNAAKNLVKNGVNGYVCEPTAKSLAANLKKVLDNKQVFAENAIQTAQKYAWDKLAVRQAEVYAL